MTAKKGLPGLIGKTSMGEYQHNLKNIKRMDIGNYTFGQGGQPTALGPRADSQAPRSRKTSQMYESAQFYNMKDQLGMDHLYNQQPNLAAQSAGPRAYLPGRQQSHVTSNQHTELGDQA